MRHRGYPARPFGDALTPRPPSSTASRPCPGCRSGSATAAGVASGFDIRKCAACGTLFVAQLQEDEVDKDYGSFYAQGRNVAVPAFVLGRLEETVASLARYRTGLNRWLDVGCGTGTLLRAAVSGGWNALGTEVAPAAVEAVRADGLEALLGTTDQLDIPAASFDVISMVEVIEHVPDSDGLLADAARLLRPGGALYITTPHGRSLSARLLGAGWSVVCPPDHLQLFSIEGLRAALGRAGLGVSSAVTHGINPYELRRGLRPRRSARGGQPSLTETSYRINESLSTRRTGRIVKQVANTALSRTRLGDTLKVVAERTPV